MSFSYFPKVALNQGEGYPQYLFVDHVTIFNSRPKQHLTWSSLQQKIGNGWKLLMTVTQSFILNVTGLLDPTLKCIDKFTLMPFTCSKSAKNTRSTCQINSKLTIKTPEGRLVLLLSYGLGKFVWLYVFIFIHLT